jgi:2-deoxy-D-gluconate 3-dehydrogenase
MGLKQFDLTGKTALVTGASKGIGKAMAIGLAEAGADIIGVSNSLAASGSEVENAVLSLGKKFKAYQADLTSRDSLYAFIKKLFEENPAIDILVNNAGTILRAPAAEHSDEYWDKVLNINLDAQFILARETHVETRKRKDHFHLFLIELPGWRKCAGIRCQQGRHRKPRKSTC